MEKKQSKKPSPETAEKLPKPRAAMPPASDVAVFMHGGVQALKQKIIGEEAPKLMEKATVMGFNMTQVATIVSEVRRVLTNYHVTAEVMAMEPAALRALVREELKRPAPVVNDETTPKEG